MNEDHYEPRQLEGERESLTEGEWDEQDTLGEDDTNQEDMDNEVLWYDIYYAVRTARNWDRDEDFINDAVSKALADSIIDDDK